MEEELLTPLQPSSPSTTHVSNKLENALTNPRLTGMKRLQVATWIEMRMLSNLGGPAVVMYLLNNIISKSTQIFCGHLGNLQLAAVSLGNNGVQTFAYGLLVPGNGERGGDALRAGVRGPQVRDARSLRATVNDPADRHGDPVDRLLRLLKTAPSAIGRVIGDIVGGGGVHLRAHPTDLRVRLQLPHPEVPPIAEHSVSERRHLGDRALHPPRADVAGGVRFRLGYTRRRPNTQPLVVAHRARPVRIHRCQPQVQAHVEGVYVGGLHWVVGFPEAVDGVGGDAVLGDVHDNIWMGLHDFRRI
ncbi:hypothetical protein V2J09_019306 [Rumex salicifolius]